MGSSREKYWEEKFSKIPKGKGWLVPAEQHNYATVRTALKSLQDKGKFDDLYVKTKKVGDDRVAYVIKPSEKAFKQGKAG